MFQSNQFKYTQVGASPPTRPVIFSLSLPLSLSMSLSLSLSLSLKHMPTHPLSVLIETDRAPPTFSEIKREITVLTFVLLWHNSTLIRTVTEKVLGSFLLVMAPELLLIDHELFHSVSQSVQ